MSVGLTLFFCRHSCPSSIRQQVMRSAPAIDFGSAAEAVRGGGLGALRDTDEGNVLMLEPHPVAGWTQRLEIKPEKQPFGRKNGGTDLPQ